MKIVVAQNVGNVAYCGVAIRTGSRDDGDNPGIAHFVEHTIFKGTPTRNSYRVSNRMESVGGELNAYTNKEETMIYVNAPAGYEQRGIELMSDLIKNACFPANEVELERGVIQEEIYSYRDNASEAVFDEFDELLYAGTPIGHNILGTPESVAAIKPEMARTFVDTNYVPSQMVAYCLSPSDPRHIVKLFEKYFNSLDHPAPQPRAAIKNRVAEHFDELRDRGNHQANTIVGARIFGRQDPRRHALFLMNNYLGGPAMTSRLNRELREKRGYVYTVDSMVSLLSDAGAFMVYFGSEPKNVEKCRRIINREIERLAEKLLAERTFNAAKEQYCGQLLVSSDNNERMAMNMANGVLRTGLPYDIRSSAKAIREVTREQVREVAAMIAEKGLSRLTLI